VSKGRFFFFPPAKEKKDKKKTTPTCVSQKLVCMGCSASKDLSLLERLRDSFPKTLAILELQQYSVILANAFLEADQSGDLTLNLLDAFRDSRFDIVLVKREPAADARLAGGVRVWREPLVWAAADGYQPQECLSLANA
jgi:hypothetical protein